MEEFRSAMVQVDAGEAVTLEPVAFGNRVTEAQLEKWLLASPELAGGARTLWKERYPAQEGK
jgi:hypothetical protein